MGLTVIDTWFVNLDPVIKIYNYRFLPKKLLSFIENKCNKKIGNMSVLFFTKETIEFDFAAFRYPYIPLKLRVLK
jgi:hypothetical protein